VFAAALALVLVGGCGVSQTSGPVDLGDAAVAEPFSGGVVKEPPSPDGAAQPADLVTRYLQAAVGENEKAVERVRRFFTPKASWNPSTELTVVRIIDGPSPTLQAGGRHRVAVRMQKVGTLRAGAIDPATDPSPFTATFIVVAQGAPTQWRLEEAPDDLMISDTTLESHYQPSPVYFWNLERTHLVPDMRYVPLTMGVNERLNQVVDWQLNGPSAWLEPAVYFQPGAKLKERMAPSASAVVVNLSSGADSDDPHELQRLTDQLRWTLRPYVQLPLELKIEGQTLEVKGSGDEYLASNAAAVPRDPALFSVAGAARKVVRKRGSGPVRVLEAPDNASVSYAAISAYPHDVAAFVGVNGRKLTIVRTGTTQPEDEKFPSVQVRNLPPPIGRPVWIPGQGSEQFLVPAGGQLWVVDTKGRSKKPTSIGPNGIGAVTSVSVSPDGRRVALAAGGRAFVGALAVANGSVQKIGSQLRELVPDRMTVNAVAWTSESKVLVAGANSADKAALFRVSADGAVATEESPGEAPLIDVIAFPDRTGGESGSADDIIARTAGAVFYVYSRTVQEASDLNFPFYAG
jgi:hypothetical protein